MSQLFCPNRFLPRRPNQTHSHRPIGTTPSGQSETPVSSLHPNTPLPDPYRQPHATPSLQASHQDEPRHQSPQVSPDIHQRTAYTYCQQGEQEFPVQILLHCTVIHSSSALPATLCTAPTDAAFETQRCYIQPVIFCFRFTAHSPPALTSRDPTHTFSILPYKGVATLAGIPRPPFSGLKPALRQFSALK